MATAVSIWIFVAVIVGGLVLAWYILRRRHTVVNDRGEKDEQLLSR